MELAPVFNLVSGFAKPQAFFLEDIFPAKLFSPAQIHIPTSADA